MARLLSRNCDKFCVCRVRYVEGVEQEDEGVAGSTMSLQRLLPTTVSVAVALTYILLSMIYH